MGAGRVNARADVVVIGAGIVGAACAHALSRRGLNVHVVERAYPASGTSRACDGLILLWDKRAGTELALGQRSAARWQELAEALEGDFLYARRGTLLLAEGEASMGNARAKAGQLRAVGVRSEVLDPGELLELEPGVAPDLPGGVLFPDDAQVDPRRATLALLADARRRGMTLHSGAEVTAIRRAERPAGPVIGVSAGSLEIDAPAVVCAAGVWSPEIGRLAGLEVPVRPRKGQILVLRAEPGQIRHPALEGGYAEAVEAEGADVQVALVVEPTGEGSLLVGSSREFAGFDRSVSREVMSALAARAIRFFPGLASTTLIRSYAGLRPWSPDHLPLIGPVDTCPGFYLATGHEGAGIGLAPITGDLIAAWVSGDGRDTLAEQVRPNRMRLDRVGGGHPPL